MDERRPSWGLTILAGAMFVFLLAPLIVVVPLSFSGDNYMVFPPSSWSFRWYLRIVEETRILSAFWVSLSLAGATTFFCLLVGLPAAYALVRLKPPFVTLLSSIYTAPLLLPSIVLALAILIVFAYFGLLGTFQGLMIGHVVVTLPYAVRILATSIDGLPLGCEEAAATLGASPFTVFRRVTLPLMFPGIAATAALCFLVSFDEVVLSLFLVGPRVTTLPVEMFHYVETRSDPLVAALSVILLIVTFAIVLIVDRSMGLARAFAR